MQQTQEFIVSEENSGMRVDKFLSLQMPQFSRSEIQRFTVTRGGATVKFSERTRPGDVFFVNVYMS